MADVITSALPLGTNCIRALANNNAFSDIDAGDDGKRKAGL